MPYKITFNKFFIIIILINLPIIIGIVFFVNEIKSINNINYTIINDNLDTHLSNKEGVSFELPDDFNFLDESNFNIFLFGASSVLISDNATFDYYLEHKLKKINSNIKITNFGVSGIDSFSVKKRINEVLGSTKVKPDIIMLYFGNNDYTNAYHSMMFNHFESFDFLLKFSFLFSNRDDPTLDNNFAYWWYIQYNRPRILKFFQIIRLLKIEEIDYRGYNQLILHYFKQNTNQIIDLTSSLNIPVIIITPIGNLYKEPYGDINTVTYNYKLGLKSNDYNTAIYYLTKAKDAESLTASMRAKSELNDFLRNISNKNVHIFDLETILIRNKFDFSDSSFLDYFHFNDKSHRLIAHYLQEFMLNQNEKLIMQQKN